MKFSLDKHLDVDLQYIFGSKWNVNAEDLQNYEAVISNAEKRVQRIRETGKGPGGKAVLFSRLPYILDEKKLSSSWQQMVDEYHHQVIYALNGAGQEYKDEHFGFADCILAGKKHQQEYLGGYWIYQSDRPTIQKQGTLRRILGHTGK